MHIRSLLRAFTTSLCLVIGSASTLAVLNVSAAHDETDVVWAVNMGDVLVMPRTWTRIPWDAVLVNTLPDSSVDAEGVWTLPPGIYSLMVETAWPNVHGIPQHRRKARVVSASYPVASHETNSAVTCGCPDDEEPQTFLVEMQPGQGEDMPLWVEVWHNADQPLILSALGLEAPSFMLYRLGDL
jgi:hypothetical protein